MIIPCFLDKHCSPYYGIYQTTTVLQSDPIIVVFCKGDCVFLYLGSVYMTFDLLICAVKCVCVCVG